MGLETDGEQYLAHVAAKKIIWGAAKGLAGLLAYTKAQNVQKALGIQVDPTQFATGVATFMFGALSAIHDYLKVKYPSLAKWL